KKMKQIGFFLIVIALSFNTTLNAQEVVFSNLLQNIDSREKVSLNGMWDIIIDPLENGYYSHRMQPKNDGYFRNAKMKSPSDLIEYNFDTSDQLMVPGDWNMQMEKLYYYEGTVWYKKDFKHTVKQNELVYLYF